MELDPISRVLFPRPTASYTADSFPGELIWVPRSLNPQTSSPEDCIPLCLLQCKGAQHMVVYMHSNCEDLGRCHGFCLALRHHLRVHVLAVEYPGYGISPGKACDEQRATESALVAARFAHEVLRMEWESILLLGRSIGTGPATALAAMQSCAQSGARFGGLILVAPFLSVKELCWEYVGAAASFVRERFPNNELLPQVRSPCLIIHGMKDTIVPPRHGQELFSVCTARKRFVAPAEMEHNSDLLDDVEYLIAPMREFFCLPGTKSFDMQVPSWAFEKQWVPDAATAAPTMQQRASCSLLGATCSCPGACRTCGCTAAPLGTKMVHVEPVRASCRNSMVAADIWVVEETITGAVEYSLDQPALEPDPEGLLRGAAAQAAWIERSPSPPLGELKGLKGLPPHLANDPLLGHRMAKLLQRTTEVADQALNPDALRRSPTRDSASSRASTSTPRGVPEENDYTPNDEGVRPQRPRQGVKSDRVPVARVSLVVV